MITECRRESDVLDAIAAGRWPGASPAELRAHVATCAVCGDLALAASALHDDAAVVAPIALPSAGQVWWRAELRSRAEAAQLAQRPIIAVQVVAAVVALLAMVTGVRAVAPGAWAWAVETLSVARAAGTSAGTGGDSWTLTILLGVAVWLVLASVAVLMVVRADRQAGR
jgi:hypothetical protein